MATIHAPAEAPPRFMAMLDALAVAPSRLDHPALKFILFPLVPALPAFRLHQLIAYGSPLGEYYAFGARAYITALLLWWGSWAVSLVLLAGGLRAVVELGAATTLAFRPEQCATVRRGLLRAARVAYFVGTPLWLLARLTGG